MIKSFRQMRKSLPIENLPNGQASKRLKYSEYGIGELIIVVIGILTAFQLNNWNTNRLGKIQDNTYLNNIKINLKKHFKSIGNQLNYSPIKHSTNSLSYFFGFAMFSNCHSTRQ